MIGRLLMLVLALGLVSFLGLVGYAYLGPMEPQQQELRLPVTLPEPVAPPAPAAPLAPAAPATALPEPLPGSGD